MTLDGLALIGYAFADGFVSALLIAAVVGGLALLLDTATAYRAAIFVAGVIVLAGVPIMTKLPARVDGPARPAAAAVELTDAADVDAEVAASGIVPVDGGAFGTTAIAWRSAPRVTV